ncbi:MAG: SDR family oxidoreductase [Pacificimonas sp.]
MSLSPILVTGAASGIGAALAQRLRADGRAVIGVDLHAGEGIYGCDITDVAARDALIDDLPTSLGGIAHVAGLPGTRDARQILEVNFLAVRALTAALLDRLEEGGAVVAVSSITAHRCDWEEAKLSETLAASDAGVLASAASHDGREAYALSKRLLNFWVETQAADLMRRGLRINALAPGPVETPILNDFRASMGADRLAAAAEITGRHGRPEEIADAAAFLLSPDSRWINGTVIDCDGGFGAVRRAEARRQMEDA